ncbi:hypothetical protein [Vibrio sp. SCSIO 43136]|uniref:hypothetical protein n=1 Tax=Vibrio sp. SCSIO 43136 TaxID=2819101 RepID=UPI002075E8FF|nr:hypothetical protein [Vibrio sp. SCSIO 43136]USD66865.1 hypothetical protein J4N39_19635 [Vibrio sp. SCSIO 43136]
MKTKRTPTDLELLNFIYNNYYEEFISWAENGQNNRASKVYVPIDCDLLASQFGVDGDVIFGRLYYHLEKKYGYKHNDGANVHFFALKVGQDMHCVNFPYLASVLADLRQENKKFKLTMSLSLLAIALSTVSIGVTVYKEILLPRAQAYNKLLKNDG